EACAAHPEWVADRDRTAVDVDAVGVESELADDDEALRREGLVQLDEVDICRIDSGAVEELAHRRDRADPHDPRVDTGHRASNDPPQRLDPELACLLLARDPELPSPVVDSARVVGESPGHR